LFTSSIHFISIFSYVYYFTYCIVLFYKQSKRKKWSKGKVREKLQNAVLFDQKQYDRMNAEVPKMKLVTIAAVSERIKLGGSLSRVGIRELVQNGQLVCVAPHSKMAVYARKEVTK